MSARSVTIWSRLAAPAERVWAHATFMPSVNLELKPWMAMTYPAEAERASLEQARLGEPLFSSWILFLRVLPIDRSRVTIAEIGPGMRFVERSPMLGLRVWQHERIVVGEGDGCRLTDTLTFEGRVPGTTAGVAVFVRWFFGRRHARLRELFGERA